MDNPRMRLRKFWDQAHGRQGLQLQAVAANKHWCSHTNLHFILRCHCFVQFTNDAVLVV